MSERHETFYFGSYAWDIDCAKEYAAAHEAEEVPIPTGLLGLIRIDPEYAAVHPAPHEPILIAPIGDENGWFGLPIDGWHRIKYWAEQGASTVQAIFLGPEESYACLTDGHAAYRRAAKRADPTLKLSKRRKPKPKKNPADIHAFPERPPRIEIGDRSYALSDDDGGLIAGALGAIVEGLAAEAPEEEIPRIGRREGGGIIEGPRGRVWRWLWVYEPESGDVGMWRLSDGEEKIYDKASRRRPTLQQLDHKGQLNTVTPDELHEVEAFMRERGRETMASLEATIEAGKTDEERQVDQLVQQYFDERVAPEVKRRLAEVERGVIPFGFRPFERSEMSEERQLKGYVWGQLIKERFGLADVEAYVGQFVDLDQMDIQAVYWALNDVMYRQGDRYLR